MGLTKKYYLTAPQKAIVLRIAAIVERVCGAGHKEAFLIAKKACVFNVPKRYAGGKTVTKGY